MATVGKDQLGRKLLQLKETLDQQKTQRSELQGELKTLMKQLKDDHGVESVEAAEALIEKERAELDKLERDIRQGIEEIEQLMSQED